MCYYYDVMEWYLPFGFVYCEQSLSETTIYFQSVYYDDTVSSKHPDIYMNQQQERILWGSQRRGGEREKESSKLTE
jgi:hypothetical protein